MWWNKTSTCCANTTVGLLATSRGFATNYFQWISWHSPEKPNRWEGINSTTREIIKYVFDSALEIRVQQCELAILHQLWVWWQIINQLSAKWNKHKPLQWCNGKCNQQNMCQSTVIQWTSNQASIVTFRGLLTHLCFACSVPSHYLNHSWSIASWTLWSNTVQIKYILFFQGNVFKNVACNMSNIFFKPQCVYFINQYLRKLNLKSFVTLTALAKTLVFDWAQIIYSAVGIIYMDMWNQNGSQNKKHVKYHTNT